jgi:hypothetical protein
MWDPRRLTILWAFTAGYRDSSAFLPYVCTVHTCICVWVLSSYVECVSPASSNLVTVKLKHCGSCIYTCGVWFKVVNMNHARFDVLGEVDMESYIFWYIATCSPLKVNRSFGGTYRLHLQLDTIFRLVSCLACSSTLKNGGDMFLRNVGWLPTDCTSLYPRRYLYMSHGFVDVPLTSRLRWQMYRLWTEGQEFGTQRGSGKLFPQNFVKNFCESDPVDIQGAFQGDNTWRR